MLFNSLHFAIFLPIVYLLYWVVSRKSLRAQNILLLICSYYFYGSWDWRFLFLLMFSTLLDFFTGIKMSDARNINQKRFWFWLSVGVNLGFLGVFKYFNFFAESFADLLSGIGLQVNPWTLKVILPVGISFYTFHGLSYVIDIYKDKIRPEKNFVNYALFVGYFPLLVAGPIERATHLLPQIQKPRTFDYSRSVDGLRQILWGLFKKIVIADQCAEYANMIFNDYESYSGSTLLMGALFFTFQIYGDFSGYSDIALGTSRLLGIELLRNFAYPYFSRDIAEFWRRWHISLSSWFKDYLYIPLGGSKVSNAVKIRNTFIIFLVSGFWHGANWTFIVWGLLNAIYILPSIIFGTNRNNLDIVSKGKTGISVYDFGSILLTFMLTVFAWIFFRSENLDQAFYIVNQIFSFSLFSIPSVHPLYLFSLIFLFMMIEWIGKDYPYPIYNLGNKWKPYYRYGFYYTLIAGIIWFSGKEHEFIYFQF